MIESHGKYNEKIGQFEFTCLRNEDVQFLFNNLRLELKDHNRAHINPGFVSRTLVDRDFQHTINSLHFLISGRAVLDFNGEKMRLKAGDVFLIGNHVKCSWEYWEPSEEITLLFNQYLGSLTNILSPVSGPLPPLISASRPILPGDFKSKRTARPPSTAGIFGRW